MKLNRDNDLWYKYVLRICSSGRRKPLLKQNQNDESRYKNSRRTPTTPVYLTKSKRKNKGSIQLLIKPLQTTNISPETCKINTPILK